MVCCFFEKEKFIKIYSDEVRKQNTDFTSTENEINTFIKNNKWEDLNKLFKNISSPRNLIFEILQTL